MYKHIRKQLNGILKPAGGPRGACSGTEHVPEFEPQRHIRLLTFNVPVAGLAHKADIEMGFHLFDCSVSRHA